MACRLRGDNSDLVQNQNFGSKIWNLTEFRWNFWNPNPNSIQKSCLVTYPKILILFVKFFFDHCSMETVLFRGGPSSECRVGPKCRENKNYENWQKKIDEIDGILPDKCKKLSSKRNLNSGHWLDFFCLVPTRRMRLLRICCFFRRHGWQFFCLQLVY